MAIDLPDDFQLSLRINIDELTFEDLVTLEDVSGKPADALLKAGSDRSAKDMLALVLIGLQKNGYPEATLEDAKALPISRVMKDLTVTDDEAVEEASADADPQ